VEDDQNKFVSRYVYISKIEVNGKVAEI
jgi:hypothetical protein